MASAGETAKGADSPGADVNAGGTDGHDPSQGRERGEAGTPPDA